MLCICEFANIFFRKIDLENKLVIQYCAVNPSTGNIMRELIPKLKIVYQNFKFQMTNQVSDYGKWF